MSGSRRPPPANDPADPLRRAVREAISAYAPDEVAERALQVALERASLTGVPRSPRALRRFVELWLRAEIVARLGEEAADGVSDRLARVIAAIDWRDGGAPTANGATWSPDEGGAKRPRVIVISSDVRLAAGIRLELEGRAVVVGHPELGEAIRVGALGSAPCALVLDGRSADAIAKDALRAEGASIVAVLAWGTKEDLAQRARDVLGRDVPVVRCGEEVTVEELALLLGARLGLRG
ncbi:hypothetical protein [Sandaracinus amylolyticus]|uniref:hypothetical protein n=1 Tax=Sandaracinus amylolyticus TaxID=927083 RepID=UPI0012ED9834|nr:hypothetical protein [Sandaracinus amylolyticus]